MQQAGVLCVGRVYCDLIFTGLDRMPTPGTEVFSDALSLCAGGGAAITAAHLARLGRPVHLATHLPAPPFDQIVLRDLSVAGANTERCLPAVTGADPQLTVALVERGDRAFVTRRSGPAVPNLNGTDIVANGIGHIHVGELTSLVGAPWIIELAQSLGLSLSLDCGWDEALGAECAPLLQDVDLFLPNRDERKWLDSLGLDLTATPLVVEKRGAEGAGVIVPANGIEVPPPCIDVLDPTGAGDAFNAGFINAWLDGAALEACLAAGNESGAYAAARVGGMPVPPDPERVRVSR